MTLVKCSYYVTLLHSFTNFGPTQPPVQGATSSRSRGLEVDDSWSSLRMIGVMPPHDHTSSWYDAYLDTGELVC
jgi:hypothetical protein